MLPDGRSVCIGSGRLGRPAVRGLDVRAREGRIA